MPLFEKKNWIFNMLTLFYLPLTIKREQRMDYCFDYDWYSIIDRIVYKAEPFADKSQYVLRNQSKKWQLRAFYNNAKIFVLREAWQNDAHFYFTALINSKRRKMQLIMHKGYCVRKLTTLACFSYTVYFWSKLISKHAILLAVIRFWILEISVSES